MRLVALLLGCSVVGLAEANESQLVVRRFEQLRQEFPTPPAAQPPKGLLKPVPERVFEHAVVVMGPGGKQATHLQIRNAAAQLDLKTQSCIMTALLYCRDPDRRLRYVAVLALIGNHLLKLSDDEIGCVIRMSEPISQADQQLLARIADEVAKQSEARSKAASDAKP
jgi:hypothetical protein